jgi:hypothetical protein
MYIKVVIGYAWGILVCQCKKRGFVSQKQKKETCDKE